MLTDTDFNWAPHVEKFRRGCRRAELLRDLLVSDINRIKLLNKPVVLDIGCGKGFDDDLELQRELSEYAKKYIGVEPDTSITISDAVHEKHICTLEDADITPESVDLAFSIMVLEHVTEPELFWNKIHSVLKPGGVAWGITVSKNHWFTHMSTLMETLKIKDLYLGIVKGKRGVDRYENYPAVYRSNTPDDIREQAQQFRSFEYMHFDKQGQHDFYFPKSFKWAGRLLDSVNLKMGGHGSLLVVRLIK